MTALPSEGRAVRFRLPRATLLLNKVQRMHWREISRRNAHLSALIARMTLGQVPDAPFIRAHLRVERHSVGLPDHDGLTGGCKGLIDCLLPRGALFLRKNGVGKLKWGFPHPHGLGIIQDDSPHCLTMQFVSVVVRHRAEQGTLVTVLDLGDF